MVSYINHTPTKKNNNAHYRLTAPQTIYNGDHECCLRVQDEKMCESQH